jgi:hypothetical protein
MRRSATRVLDERMRPMNLSFTHKLGAQDGYRQIERAPHHNICQVEHHVREQDRIAA